MASGKFNRTAIVVQCRLSSTRLPQKALKLLGQKECLCWTLDAMKKVPAARYFLACDYDSKSLLEPIAKKCGWEIFAGERDDVLGRFCALIESEISNCDLIVRATGDNPFLFWEAAEASIKDFEENHFEADYFTYSGLPHGSGVELFKSASLLKARQLTDSPYDKEHVGPSLYRHPENFLSVFKSAPKEFCAPNLRTTIDTFADYKRAQRLLFYLQEKSVKPPFSAKEIVSALESPFMQKAFLIVPSVKAGRGTGHLRRALSLALKTKSFVYIPQDFSLAQGAALISGAKKKGLEDFQIVSQLSGGWDLVLLDLFRSSKDEMKTFKKLGPVCSLDDGGAFCQEADYLLDVIPSMPRSASRQNPKAGGANFFAPQFLDFPKNRRPSFPKKIKSALVCVSGETRWGLSQKAVNAARALGVQTLEVSSKNPVDNLSEKLFSYDLIATHYGFTAFEAAAANCAVLLLSSSPLHKRLAKKYGFKCLDKNSLSPKKMRTLFENPSALENKEFKTKYLSQEERSLADFAATILSGQKFSCPVCREKENDGRIFARTKSHSFRRCPICKSLYLSFSADSRVQYEEDYFGAEYKAQYGRTYLDDFGSIKTQGERRCKEIVKIFPRRAKEKKRLLDIGCAYGPFLAAAKDFGFEPFGTDISQSALEYVKNQLGFECVSSSFADFDVKKTFGFERFDVVTMWYVIEHCQDLKSLLPRVSSMLKNGGVFAFSTPSASGVSARFNRQSFFESSPRDHYTLWEPRNAARILRRFGFKLIKIVPTGIHPERIGFFKNLCKKPFIFKLLALFCKAFVLGDTFEVYCKKIKDAE